MAACYPGSLEQAVSGALPLEATLVESWLPHSRFTARTGKLQLHTLVNSCGDVNKRARFAQSGFKKCPESTGCITSLTAQPDGLVAPNLQAQAKLGLRKTGGHVLNRTVAALSAGTALECLVLHLFESWLSGAGFLN